MEQVAELVEDRQFAIGSRSNGLLEAADVLGDGLGQDVERSSAVTALELLATSARTRIVAPYSLDVLTA